MDKELEIVLYHVRYFLDGYPVNVIPSMILLDLYKLICELRLLFVKDNRPECELVAQYGETVRRELRRRNVLPMVMMLCFDKENNIVEGKDELLPLFANMSLPQIRVLVDNMAQLGITEKQREAIINFAAENLHEE
jgi:hypothetical protein